VEVGCKERQLRGGKVARGDMTTEEMERGEYGRGTRGCGTGGDTHRIVDENLEQESEKNEFSTTGRFTSGGLAD